MILSIKSFPKKAYDTEMARLLAEKPYSPNPYEYNDSEMKRYEKFINSKEYKTLANAAESAGNAKDKYVSKLGKEYVDVIKEAKIKDMKIPDQYKSLAKEVISSSFYDFVWDGNMQYNPDSYYEPGIEKQKFKRGS